MCRRTIQTSLALRHVDRDDWKEDVTWMGLYFFLGMYAPKLEPSSRSDKDKQTLLTMTNHDCDAQSDGNGFERKI